MELPSSFMRVGVSRGQRLGSSAFLRTAGPHGVGDHSALLEDLSGDKAWVCLLPREGPQIKGFPSSTRTGSSELCWGAVVAALVLLG